MRKTTSKGRKASNNVSDQSATDNSASIQMELELLALRAKNAELTRANAKVVHENYEMRDEILSLRRALMDSETTQNRVLNEIAREMKRSTPALLDVLNLFLRYTDTNSRPSLLFNSNRVSSHSPKNKSITHAVKPHTVNGTVLNLNPTISLTRINSDEDEQMDVSTTDPDYRNCQPSTSRDSHDSEQSNLNDGNDESPTSNEESSAIQVLRRSQRTSSPLESDDESEMENNDRIEDEFEKDDSSARRLATIHEESITSEGRQTRVSVGEIRIFLSRLSNEEIQARLSHNDTCTSTEANINDTCLNIETTLIENQENHRSKRLRTDIMVFSPNPNSSRMDNDTSLLNKSGILRTSSPNTLLDVSPIQSAQVTPGIDMSAAEESLVPSSLAWLPTPSMSAMGDIDESTYGRMEISGSERKFSPRPSIASVPRSTRSRSKRKTPVIENGDDSPKSSRDSQTDGLTRHFVSRQRGSGTTSCQVVQNFASPTIILVRHEDLLAQTSPVTEDGNHGEKENIVNNIPNKSKRSRNKSQSRSPGEIVKRKKTLHEKIRDVQIRLSNYVADNSTDCVDSPKNCSKRPSRAAKPKILKDPSLKVKMRRMF